jgi:hypothetical protein
VGRRVCFSGGYAMQRYGYYCKVKLNFGSAQPERDKVRSVSSGNRGPPLPLGTLLRVYPRILYAGRNIKFNPRCPS